MACVVHGEGVQRILRHVRGRVRFHVSVEIFLHLLKIERGFILLSNDVELLLEACDFVISVFAIRLRLISRFLRVVPAFPREQHLTRRNKSLLECLHLPNRIANNNVMRADIISDKREIDLSA
jgi:hypothetical protein